MSQSTSLGWVIADQWGRYAPMLDGVMLQHFTDPLPSELSIRRDIVALEIQWIADGKIIWTERTSQ